MIRLAGLPADAIEVKFSGARPGEKLFEELYFDNETTLPTEHPKIRAAWHRPVDYKEQLATVNNLKQIENAPREQIIRVLHDLIPEFRKEATETPSAVYSSVADDSDVSHDVVKPR